MKMKNWLFAGFLGVVAAVVYFASLAGYAFPGESAHLMAVWRGLTSETQTAYPLMAIFAKALGGGNLIAPVCGIVSVVTLFHLVAAFVAWRVRSETLSPQREGISLVAAAVTCIVFIFAPAVRAAATHLEPRLFDFTWALLSFALAFPFFRGWRKASLIHPILLGGMMALGALDSAIFVAMAPLYIAQTVCVGNRAGRKFYLPVIFLAVGFVIAMALSVWLLDVDLLGVLRRTAQTLKSYRTIPGWLFVAAFTTLPFVTALFSSGKAFGEKPSPVQWFFHVAMSFVSILAIATPLAPAALLEPFGILPVVTSAFAAAVAGYLTAYWWGHRRRVIGMITGGILVFVLSVSTIWNLFTFDGDMGDFADKVARKIIDDLGSRRWFVSDGLLDDHILLAAADAGKTINIISLVRDRDKAYLDKLAETVRREGVGGSRNGMLRMSLSLGVLPFVQDWLSTDPSAAKEVAIFGAPDIWTSAGRISVPEFLFFGADESVTPDWSVWKEFDGILKAPKGWGSYHDRNVANPVERLRFSLRRHVGFVANNRGVYLQDRKRDDEAFRMYELVLNEIDHDNICAIFNEVAMIGQKHPEAMGKKRELERMLKSAVEDKQRRYILWRLSTFYGYIRDPDMFIRLGHAWARSGRPGDALSQIRRAIDFVPTDKRSILMNMMASLYASGNDQRQSRAIYESVLAKNAKDHDALVGLMRLELQDGNSAKALDYLQRAVEVTTDARRKNIELAMLAMMKNDLAEARAILKKATDADQKDMQAWSLLAAVTMQQIDAATSESEKKTLMDDLEVNIVPTMEKRAEGQFDYHLQTTRGFALLRQGEEKRRAARDAFVNASKARPDIAATQDMVLGLDISLDDKENAEEHAKTVLRRNRNAPLANYVLGSLALGRGQYEEAEVYLRKAADAQKPVVLALNDLAEVLRRKKDFPEAERYARKATETAPELYVAWETLGAILMDSNTGLDEAEACIRKACQLSKDKDGKEADVRMLVSLARIQIRRNDMQHAKVTVRKVRQRINELSDFEKREFEEVTKGVR